MAKAGIHLRFTKWKKASQMCMQNFNFYHFLLRAVKTLIRNVHFADIPQSDRSNLGNFKLHIKHIIYGDTPFQKYNI